MVKTPGELWLPASSLPRRTVLQSMSGVCSHSQALESLQSMFFCQRL